MVACWPPEKSAYGVMSVQPENVVKLTSILTAGNVAGAGTDASPLGSSRTGMSGHQQADHRHIVGLRRGGRERERQVAGALRGEEIPAGRRTPGTGRGEVRHEQRRALQRPE